MNQIAVASDTPKSHAVCTLDLRVESLRNVGYPLAILKAWKVTERGQSL
jgi:hypothetical protein